MPTSMEAHAAAVDRAQAWLREHTPAVRKHEPSGVRVDARDHQGGDQWRCELAVPHPADVDMEITAAASGFGREGVMELALTELRTFLVRCWLEPQVEVRRLCSQREELPYEPSPQSIDRALRCLRDREVLDVPHVRVGTVGLRVCHEAPPGVRVTVGDVVTAVLAQLEQDGDGQIRLSA